MPSTLTMAINSFPRHFLRVLVTHPPPWTKDIQSLSQRRRLLSLIYSILHICTLALRLLIPILHLQCFYRQQPPKPLCHMINRVKKCIRPLQTWSNQWSLLTAPKILLNPYTPCPISMLALHPQVPSHALSKDGYTIYTRPFHQLQRQPQYTVEKNLSVGRDRVIWQHGNIQSQSCLILTDHFLL